MKKKEKLISALKVAINALETGAVHYQWERQESCNCGVVAQAILGTNLYSLRREFDEGYGVILPHMKKTDIPIDHTWKNLVKFGCSITGEPLLDILKRLKEAGMSPEDIVHLEYMSHPGILAKVELKSCERTRKVKKRVKHSNFFLRLIGLTQEKEVVRKVQCDPHTSQENLVTYLKAWVSILGSEVTEQTNLQEKLLHAVADENYELAADLRDMIAKEAS